MQSDWRCQTSRPLPHVSLLDRYCFRCEGRSMLMWAVEMQPLTYAVSQCHAMPSLCPLSHLLVAVILCIC